MREAKEREASKGSGKHQRGQASLIASLALCGYDFAFLRSNITSREHPEPTKQADFITRSIAETCERIFFAKKTTLPRSNKFCMKVWRSEQVELYSYQLMSNHYHLVLRPLIDGEMSRFMGWIGGTHTMRYHAHYHTSGLGHVYQQWM